MSNDLNIAGPVGKILTFGSVGILDPLLKKQLLGFNSWVYEYEIELTTLTRESKKVLVPSDQIWLVKSIKHSDIEASIFQLAIYLDGAEYFNTTIKDNDDDTEHTYTLKSAWFEFYPNDLIEKHLELNIYNADTSSKYYRVMVEFEKYSKRAVHETLSKIYGL